MTYEKLKILFADKLMKDSEYKKIGRTKLYRFIDSFMSLAEEHILKGYTLAINGHVIKRIAVEKSFSIRKKESATVKVYYQEAFEDKFHSPPLNTMKKKITQKIDEGQTYILTKS